jgi:hypothetical protein
MGRLGGAVGTDGLTADDFGCIMELENNRKEIE